MTYNEMALEALAASGDGLNTTLQPTCARYAYDGRTKIHTAFPWPFRHVVAFSAFDTGVSTINLSSLNLNSVLSLSYIDTNDSNSLVVMNKQQDPYTLVTPNIYARPSLWWWERNYVSDAVSVKKIKIYPTPTASYAGIVLNVNGLAKVSLTTNYSDTIDLPDEYLPLLRTYVDSRWAFRKGYLEEGKALMEDFDARLVAMAQEFGLEVRAQSEGARTNEG